MFKNKISILSALVFTLPGLYWGISDAVAQSVSKSDVLSSTGSNIKPVKLPLGIVSFDRCNKPAYPRSALRDELVGTTEMDLIADADGKVIVAEVARSSGWRVLDDAIVTAMMGCQIFDNPKAENTFGRAAYSWRLKTEDSSYKPAEMLTGTCNKSAFVSLAKSNEPGRGIVVGVWLNKDGGIEKTSLQWSLEPNLNEESVKLVSSCKFKPAFDAVGSLASVISLRLLPLRLK